MSDKMRFEVEEWQGAWSIVDNATEDEGGAKDITATVYDQQWAEKIRSLLEIAGTRGELPNE